MLRTGVRCLVKISLFVVGSSVVGLILGWIFGWEYQTRHPFYQFAIGDIVGANYPPQSIDEDVIVVAVPEPPFQSFKIAIQMLGINLVERTRLNSAHTPSMELVWISATRHLSA